MELAEATRQKLDSLIGSDRVVLFMKGNRQGPQCGFSATVVQILDRLVADYTTVDVLSDPEVRDGVKTYSSWPTIPQLYVGGEFIGGCDIIQEMFGSGELQEALGVAMPSDVTPELELTEAAAEALKKLLTERPEGRELHLAIDARQQAGLFIGPEEPGDLRTEARDIVLLMDPLTASRANGLTIDAEDGPDGPAFRIGMPGAGE